MARVHSTRRYHRITCTFKYTIVRNTPPFMANWWWNWFVNRENAGKPKWDHTGSHNSSPLKEFISRQPMFSKIKLSKCTYTHPLAVQLVPVNLTWNELFNSLFTYLVSLIGISPGRFLYFACEIWSDISPKANTGKLMDYPTTVYQVFVIVSAPSKQKLHCTKVLFY
jgi:hypothetical protein